MEDSDAEETLNHGNEESIKSEIDNIPPNKIEAQMEDGQSKTKSIRKEEVVRDYLEGISFLSSFGFHFASAESVPMPPITKEDSEQYLDVENKDGFGKPNDSNKPTDGGDF